MIQILILEMKEEIEKTKIKANKEKIFAKLNGKKYKQPPKKDITKENNIIQNESDDITDDKPINKKEEKTNKSKKEDIHPNLFFFKNKDNNEKLYTFHRIYKEFYYLRCTDRHCGGTAKYNTLTGITESNECSIEFQNHSYVKEALIKKKLKKIKLKMKI